jgi:hypothetical protein
MVVQTIEMQRVADAIATAYENPLSEPDQWSERQITNYLRRMSRQELRGVEDGPEWQHEMLRTAFERFIERCV